MTSKAYILALLVGCTPLTELEREQLQFNKWAYAQQFRIDMARCVAANGIMIIHGAMDYKGVPRYKTKYECVRRGSLTTM